MPRPTALAGSRTSSAAAPRWTDRTSILLAGIAAVTALSRLPFLFRPMGSDEGGLLLIGSQWHPGTSLYGDYWVDRPPLLIDVFALADQLGGLLALRLIGLVAVVLAVLLAGRIGRLVGGSPVAAAVSAAALLGNPLLGVHEVNGELIATPFVLGSFALALAAARATSLGRRTGLLVGAGAAAAAALLVKQNELDGFVLLGVGLLTFLAVGREAGDHRSHRRLALLAVVGGALALAAVVLVPAAARGTSLSGLWDAVVTFRMEASQVIGVSTSGANSRRLELLVLAFVASGAPFLLLALVRGLRRGTRPGALDLRWATVAVLAWEAVSVLGGGSFWLHYLICLVPGLVLATSVLTAATTARARSLTASLAFCCVSTLVCIPIFAVQPILTATDPVITWLRAHRAVGDTGLVAFGHPDYLTASQLTSPYPELWSLPVRVRDPDLHRLAAVLGGPQRPDWVVTNASGSLAGWDLDARAAQQVLDRDYRQVADLGDRRIYRSRSDSQENP